MTNSATTPHSVVLERAALAIARSRGLTPGLVAGFVGIIIVLIATLPVGLANLRNVYETGETVAHTHTVKARVEQLVSTPADMETGERGFVITGEASFPVAEAAAAVKFDTATV